LKLRDFSRIKKNLLLNKVKQNYIKSDEFDNLPEKKAYMPLCAFVPPFVRLCGKNT
jgi:hypothetical protein